ncbi:transcriptional regulator [Corynebacterium rouxii]|uniref:Winged helix DNA-binding domain-containing protein n=1 Tax=Corynebacterium rouxii TaxID=2719119 RepID=A0A6I8MGA0_9CORY|nr:transcriptional regulator [Corynebacterium rouxii]VZH86004.1 hypothetical protein FRC0190_01937 [Corynebacterium rouxii]
MKMNEAFEGIDPLIHSPNRLGVMACLASVDSATYQSLKEELGLSYSSLSKSISSLEESGMVNVSKRFIGKKATTDLFLTRQGKKAYFSYLACLDRIVMGFSPSEK